MNISAGGLLPAAMAFATLATDPLMVLPDIVVWFLNDIWDAPCCAPTSISLVTVPTKSDVILVPKPASSNDVDYIVTVSPTLNSLEYVGVKKKSILVPAGLVFKKKIAPYPSPSVVHG